MIRITGLHGDGGCRLPRMRGDDPDVTVKVGGDSMFAPHARG